MEKIHTSMAELPSIVLLCHPYSVALTPMYPCAKLQEKESAKSGSFFVSICSEGLPISTNLQLANS